MGEKMIAVPRHSACTLAGVLESCLLFWRKSADCGSPDQTRGMNLLAQAVETVDGFLDDTVEVEEVAG